MSYTIHNDFAYGAFSDESIILEGIAGGKGEWELDNGKNLIITLSHVNRKDFVINKIYQEREAVNLFLPSLFKSLFDFKRDTFLENDFTVVNLKVDTDKGNIASGTLFVIPASVTTSAEIAKTKPRLGECKNITYFKGYPQRDLYIEKITGNIPFQMQNKERNADTKEVARVVDECGIFLRWRNTYGGWSYWLFSQDYTEELKSKSLGSTRIGRTFVGGKDNSFYPFGTTAKKTWILTSEIPVLDYEFEEVKSLFVSPEIYIWKGNNANETTPNYWERVNIVEGSQKFKHNNQYTHALSVTVEFNEPKTITLL